MILGAFPSLCYDHVARGLTPCQVLLAFQVTMHQPSDMLLDSIAGTLLRTFALVFGRDIVL